MTLILDPRAAPFIDLVDFEDLPEHRANALQDMVANAKAEKRRSASLRAGPYVFLKPMLGRFRNMHTVI